MSEELIKKIERLEYAKKAVISTLNDSRCSVDFHDLEYWAKEVTRLRKEITEVL